jgi:hypothetical protein
MRFQFAASRSYDPDGEAAPIVPIHHRRVTMSSKSRLAQSICVSMPAWKRWRVHCVSAGRQAVRLAKSQPLWRGALQI